jgi:hypothetical protein
MLGFSVIFSDTCRYSYQAEAMVTAYTARRSVYITPGEGVRFMLWTIALILFVLWLLGFLFHLAGSLIHILLVAAVIVLLVQLITGRRIIT